MLSGVAHRDSGAVAPGGEEGEGEIAAGLRVAAGSLPSGAGDGAVPHVASGRAAREKAVPYEDIAAAIASEGDYDSLLGEEKYSESIKVFVKNLEGQGLDAEAFRKRLKQFLDLISDLDFEFGIFNEPGEILETQKAAVVAIFATHWQSHDYGAVEGTTLVGNFAHIVNNLDDCLKSGRGVSDVERRLRIIGNIFSRLGNICAEAEWNIDGAIIDVAIADVAASRK